MRFWCVCLVCLVGCSPYTLEDYHHEGQALTKKILDDLRPIQSREELEAAIPHLRKRFEALVALMIDASEYHAEHPNEYFEEEAYAFSIDDELLEEMKRIYELEKGKELMEKAQREPLLKLDAHKRQLMKKQSRPL